MLEVVLECGSRRTFARVPAWPGWCRSGRDEAAAIAALGDRRERYAVSVGEVLPADPLHVAERLAGNRVTDFGALGVVGGRDRAAWKEREREDQLQRLEACWAAFDAALAEVPQRRLTEKPARGRAAGAMALHVLETDLMHLSGAGGGAFRRPAPDHVHPQLLKCRKELLVTLRAAPVAAAFAIRRAAGFDWTPRWVVQRSAWHALDHAWELEDRRGGME